MPRPEARSRGWQAYRHPRTDPIAIRVAYPPALSGGRRAALLAQVLLCACVGLYWSVLTRKILRLVPYYAGELKPIARAGWLTMWTWIDYGHYYRYSPTG